MSRYTRSICSLLKAGALLGSVALAATPAAPAFAATTDPLLVLYVFPGARDNGGAAGVGVATVAHCFNFSSSPETIQYVVRSFDGALKANQSLTIGSLFTKTATTHDTALFSEDLFLSTGDINQGVLGISATSPNIVCTAQILDASASVPNGIDLHGMRLNALSGTQE